MSTINSNSNLNLSNISEDLFFLRIKRSKKIVYGLKENLKNPETKELYISRAYLSQLKKIKNDILLNKTFFIIDNELMVKLKLELKKRFNINVIGLKI